MKQLLPSSPAALRQDAWPLGQLLSLTIVALQGPDEDWVTLVLLQGLAAAPSATKLRLLDVEGPAEDPSGVAVAHGIKTELATGRGQRARREGRQTAV